LSEEVSVREQAAMVRQAVIQLTPEQKQVVELAYFEGLTQSEIASRLDQPLGTVKARIRRGVNNLREQVKPTLLSAS
jgi:RNA polymerase sigma-70 factor (ECF subfamily)